MNGIADPETMVRRCYAAAVAAVRPSRAMRGPLSGLVPGDTPCWIIGTGKASHGMAGALVDWLAGYGRVPAGGIVIGAESAAPPHAALQSLAGNHPLPGPGSERAARAIADLIPRIPEAAEVHVAISGGASALMAAPMGPLTMVDVQATFALLISSGLDISQMNAVRKRVTCWSAGRLALALAPRQVHLWVISDVPGDDVGSIASGPCTGDVWRSADVCDLLADRRLLERLPRAVRQALDHETPKPNHPLLRAIAPRIVANNAIALAAAAAAGRELGLEAKVITDPLRGEAAPMGRTIATTMGHPITVPTLSIWGGETTVTVTDETGRGGRAQELALAASQLLQSTSGVLLAAGTDGRDGPTDAAGGVVTGSTWQRIVAAGRDPVVDLRRHDSYAALEAASAHLKTGPSGTNVMDIVVAATGWD